MQYTSQVMQKGSRGLGPGALRAGSPVEGEVSEGYVGQGRGEGIERMLALPTPSTSYLVLLVGRPQIRGGGLLGRIGHP